MKFDRLARHYDWMEDGIAGKRLQRARTAWLETLAGRQRVLSVGEGHGRFAAAFAARFPQSELTCVEACRGMTERATQRVPNACNVQWVSSDFLEWNPPKEKFDAIVTCFFLDCFSPQILETIVAKLADSAHRDAVWLVADFAIPASGWRRHRARAIHALMYAFFRATAHLQAKRLTPPDRFIRAHGFRLQARRESEWGLLHSDHWQRF